jgi:hypothetical protein
MEDTLTVTRIGIEGKLKLTLQSTNPRESMISTVRAIHRNVKHWSSGDMCPRWTAAGVLEAETRFRKVQGYRSLAQPRSQDRTRPTPTPRTSRPNHNRGGSRRSHCVTITPRTAVTVKFHDERGNLFVRAWPRLRCPRAAA